MCESVCGVCALIDRFMWCGWLAVCSVGCTASSVFHFHTPAGLCALSQVNNIRRWLIVDELKRSVNVSFVCVSVYAGNNRWFTSQKCSSVVVFRVLYVCLCVCDVYIWMMCVRAWTITHRSFSAMFFLLPWKSVAMSNVNMRTTKCWSACGLRCETWCLVREICWR